MAETPSNMLPLGTKATEFILPDTRTNQMLSLQKLKSPIATVIMFICNHCPYVKHIQTKLVDVAKHYQTKNIAFIAISSNDINYRTEDGPEFMRQVADTLGFTFPYLFDETQAIAKAYQAACTPDFYIFDKDLLCVYRGRFDNSTPGNNQPVTGLDLTQALDQIIAGKTVSIEQYPSVGCNIKWKK